MSARPTPDAPPPAAWLLLPLIVAAPLSTTVGGALWLALCLAGLWLAVVPRGAARIAAPWRGPTALWLACCAASLGLEVVMTAYWSDKWSELHAPIRLVLAAAALRVLAGRMGSPSRQRLLRMALCGACLLAFAVAWVYSYNRSLPGSAIAWAVCVGFLVCLLLPAVPSAPTSLERMLAALGVLAGVLAVVLSQSRGAYGIVPWVVAVGGWWCWRSPLLPHRGARAAVGMGLLVLLVAASAWLVPAGTRDRIALGWEEAQASIEAPADGTAAGSSVGSRIALWRIAAQGFVESPWVGVGGRERIARIRAEGQRLHAPELAGLGHVHNEFLHAMLDHGLFGLAAALLLAGGLFALAAMVAKLSPTAGMQLAGIAFMHATGSLTNVNTAHNYYGAMLAACVTLALLGARREDPDSGGRGRAL